MKSVLDVHVNKSEAHCWIERGREKETPAVAVFVTPVTPMLETASLALTSWVFEEATLK